MSATTTLVNQGQTFEHAISLYQRLTKEGLIDHKEDVEAYAIGAIALMKSPYTLDDIEAEWVSSDDHYLTPVMQQVVDYLNDWGYVEARDKIIDALYEC